MWRNIFERIHQAVASGLTALITGLGDALAETLAGGSAEYHQRVRELKASEEAVRIEFEAGRLTAEQYRLEITKIAQSRAELDASKNPFKNFAARILGTLGDLMLGVAAFAVAYGIVQKSIHINPFAAAAAAFAVGVVLKALAAKIGGRLGGTGAAGGGIGAGAGTLASAGAGAQAERPLIFIRIVGQTTGETIKEIVYDSARYAALGGRPPGMGGATVSIPGGLVIARGVG